MKPNPEPSQEQIEGPAVISRDHIQDRLISTAAGAPKAWRRQDGVDWLRKRRQLNRLQEEAANRLQEDYQQSLGVRIARSRNQKQDGGHGHDISQAAIDADRRLSAALAVLTQEILSMTVLFLIPHTATTGFSCEHIGKMVGEDKRCVPFGVRTALSLLARHYGSERRD